MQNSKNIFYEGDIVRLANSALDGGSARIKYVFMSGQEVLLDTALANRTIWQVNDLVLVYRARSKENDLQ